MAADSDRRYPCVIRHMIAEINTPIVAFLTAIVTPAGLATTGENKGEGDHSPWRAKQLHTLPTVLGHFRRHDTTMEIKKKKRIINPNHKATVRNTEAQLRSRKGNGTATKVNESGGAYTPSGGAN